MKRYNIALAIVALALLFGCCPDPNAVPYPACHFQKVEFEGHTYIYWDSAAGGLEHDPNCKCHKEAKKEEHVYENPNQD